MKNIWLSFGCKHELLSQADDREHYINKITGTDTSKAKHIHVNKTWGGTLSKTEQTIKKNRCSESTTWFQIKMVHTDSTRGMAQTVRSQSRAGEVQW